MSDLHAGDYVRRLGENGAENVTPNQIATTHGVSDDGISSVWPIDDRDL